MDLSESCKWSTGIRINVVVAAVSVAWLMSCNRLHWSAIWRRHTYMRRRVFPLADFTGTAIEVAARVTGTSKTKEPTKERWRPVKIEPQVSWCNNNHNNDNALRSLRSTGTFLHDAGYLTAQYANSAHFRSYHLHPNYWYGLVFSNRRASERVLVLLTEYSNEVECRG